MCRILPLFVVLGAAVPRVARADCPPLTLMMDHAEQNILEGRLDAYPASAERVDAAFSCGSAATPKQVARAFLIQGVYQHFTGSEDGARLSFASALRVDPVGWNPDYGAEVEALYVSSLASIPPGEGTLSILPPPDAALAVVVDGVPMALPARVPVGFHVVQVTEPAGAVLAAQRALVLGADEQVVLNLGVLSSPSAVGEPTRRTSAPKPAWPLLAAGGAAVLGGGAAAWARAQDGRLESASSMAALDRAYNTQRALSATAWSFGGLAVAGLGVWVAW